MQDFFFTGILCAIALGVVLFKSIFFIIHLINADKSDQIIAANLAKNRLSNIQAQKIQASNNTYETIANWRLDDPRLDPQLTEDLRLQFLTKTKTRRTPTSDRGGSPRDRVPLATTDFVDPIDGYYDDDNNGGIVDEDRSVPIYTYNPSLKGTQV